MENIEGAGEGALIFNPEGNTLKKKSFLRSGGPLGSIQSDGSGKTHVVNI